MNTIPLLIFPVLLLGLCPAQGQRLGPNDAFAIAGLTADEVRQIVPGLERSAFDTPESWGAELRATRVDLGSRPGIVLQGTRLLCGGTGNCQLFVFQQTNGRWISMFGSEQAPIGESYQFGPTVSHGIKDLTVIANTSAEAGRRVTYEYDGRVYRARKPLSRFNLSTSAWSWAIRVN